MIQSLICSQFSQIFWIHVILYIISTDRFQGSSICLCHSFYLFFKIIPMWTNDWYKSSIKYLSICVRISTHKISFNLFFFLFHTGIIYLKALVWKLMYFISHKSSFKIIDIYWMTYDVFWDNLSRWIYLWFSILNNQQFKIRWSFTRVSATYNFNVSFDGFLCSLFEY